MSWKYLDSSFLYNFCDKAQNLKPFDFTSMDDDVVKAVQKVNRDMNLFSLRNGFENATRNHNRTTRFFRDSNGNLHFGEIGE